VRSGRGAGLLLLRVDRLGATAVIFDSDGEADTREGGLMLLVAAGEDAGGASFRRLVSGTVDVGEGVGRVFVDEGVFETMIVEDWVVLA